MNRILLRADGSKKIGMGHLNRISIIGNELSLYAESVKLLTKNNKNSHSFMKNKKIKTHRLPINKSISEEINYITNFFNKENPDIFILDVLNYKEYDDLLVECRKNNIFSIIITDESEKMNQLNADIILNGNPNQLEYNYNNYLNKYLVGPHYFIMDGIYNEKKNKKPNGVIENILLTVGGSDHNNILFKILICLDNICRNKKISVVASNASGYIDELYEIIKNMKNSVSINLDVESLSPFLENCDIAITAGGNTLFERISTRTPGATICQLQRQMEISNCFMKLGVNYNIGLGETLSQHDIENKLKFFLTNYQIHKEQYIKSKNIVDGNGLNLLISEINSLVQ